MLTYLSLYLFTPLPQCPESTDKVPYSAEEWTPQTAGLAEWEASEQALQEMKQTLFVFNQDKPSYARYEEKSMKSSHLLYYSS